MTTTQSFVPTAAPISSMLNVPAQSFVPPATTTQSMLNATAQSFVPPACTLEDFIFCAGVSVTCESSPPFPQDSSLREVSHHCPMMPVYHRESHQASSSSLQQDQMLAKFTLMCESLTQGTAQIQ